MPSASSLPSTTPKPPGFRSDSLPVTICPQVGHAALGGGIDAAHLHAAQRLPAHQHALRRHEGRAGLDGGILLGGVGVLPPLVQHAPGAAPGM